MSKTFLSTFIGRRAVVFLKFPSVYNLKDVNKYCLPDLKWVKDRHKELRYLLPQVPHLVSTSLILSFSFPLGL